MHGSHDGLVAEPFRDPDRSDLTDIEVAPVVEKTIRMLLTAFGLMWDLQLKFPFRHQTQTLRLGMSQ